MKKDDAGYAADLERQRSAVTHEAQKAAKGPADADAKERAARLSKLQTELDRQWFGRDFRAASLLLAEAHKLPREPGRAKALEAAAAYEKFAAEHPDYADAPNALYNAALAWGRAQDAKKAQAGREAVVTKYPESKIAAKALAGLAGDLSVAGDHAGAAARYSQYLSL